MAVGGADMMDELIARALLALEHPMGVVASPGLPPNAYFPPAGAQQFEVTHRSGDGTALPQSHCVWVKGKDSKSESSQCHRKCADGWIVLLDSLSPDKRADCDRVMKMYGTTRICVCICNGRLIE